MAPNSSFMEIPQAFREGVLREQGADWLAALPDQFAYWCRAWSLEVEGPPWHGYLGLAFPVRSPGRQWKLQNLQPEMQTLVMLTLRSICQVTVPGSSTALRRSASARRKSRAGGTVS